MFDWQSELMNIKTYRKVIKYKVYMIRKRENFRSLADPTRQNSPKARIIIIVKTRRTFCFSLISWSCMTWNSINFRSARSKERTYSGHFLATMVKLRYTRKLRKKKMNLTWKNETKPKIIRCRMWHVTLTSTELLSNFFVSMLKYLNYQL